MDPLIWTRKGRTLARTYIQQLCSFEDLPEAMDDWEGWYERVRETHADGMTWWWWWWLWSFLTICLSVQRSLLGIFCLLPVLLLWESFFSIFSQMQSFISRQYFWLHQVILCLFVFLTLAPTIRARRIWPLLKSDRTAIWMNFDIFLLTISVKNLLF